MALSLLKGYEGLSKGQINKTVDLTGLSREEYYSLIFQKLSSLEEEVKEYTSKEVFDITYLLSGEGRDYISMISEKVWRSLQSIFIKEMNNIDFNKTGIILPVLYSTPYFDSSKILPALEKEVFKFFNNYKNSKVPSEEIIKNLKNLIIICRVFSLNEFYNLNPKYQEEIFLPFVELFTKFHENISSDIEIGNLLVFGTILISQNQSPQFNIIKKSLHDLFIKLTSKIQMMNSILENRMVFSATEFLSKIEIVDEEIWTRAIKTIEGRLFSNEKLINMELSGVLRSLYLYQNDLRSKKNKNVPNIDNYNRLWEKLESLILKTNQKEFRFAELSDMVSKLHMSGRNMPQFWKYLTEAVTSRMEEFDKNNFIILLRIYGERILNQRKDNMITISNVSNIQKTNIPPEYEELIKKTRLFILNNIYKFNFDFNDSMIILESLSLLQDADDYPKIINVLGEKLCEPENLNKINSNNVNNIQTFLATLKINSDKLWNKVEQIKIQTPENISRDKDEFFETLKCFSFLNKGSPVIWKEFAKIVKNNFKQYDMEELLLTVQLINPLILTEKKITDVLDRNFWVELTNIIADNLVSTDPVYEKLVYLSGVIDHLRENKKLQEAIKKLS